MEAAYTRGETHELVGQRRHADLASLPILDCFFDTMVYGGPIISHYGHFLLTSLARLWAMDGTPALFHSNPEIFAHGAPFIRDILATTTLTRDNAFSPMHPTRIKRLLVPDASIIEQLRVSPTYADDARRVGAAFAETGRFTAKNYYVSKTRLSVAVARLEGEDVIERAFADRGFEIVYPETLSVADQVSLFRNAATVAGTVGSAFHTVALVPDAKGRRVIFDYNDMPNSNFALLDRGTAAKSEYWSLFGQIKRIAHPAFIAYYVAADLQNLANEMARVAASPRECTEPTLLELSGGDYVHYRNAAGEWVQDLPLAVPDDALAQIAARQRRPALAGS